VNARNIEPYNRWGNGSAMRVSPVAYAFDTLEQVLQGARASAEVTHNHPEGVRGDADTLACITGGIAGAFYGIPQDIAASAWERFHDRLQDVVTQFCRTFRINGPWTN
jgi:ADP-ribosylglycohydrolase